MKHKFAYRLMAGLMVLSMVLAACPPEPAATVPTPARRKALFDRYLPEVLLCRLEDLVVETPAQAMPLMSERLGLDVLVKREDLQPVFSFKLRGAYARLRSPCRVLNA